MPTTSDNLISRAEIIATVKEAMEKDEALTLSPHGKPISFFCSIEAVSEEWVTVDNPIPPAILPYILPARGYTLFCRYYGLESSIIIPYGTRLRFAIPEQAQRGQARTTQRTYFSHKHEDAHVDIVHPIDTNAVLQRRLFDISEAGMSFRSRANTHFMQPGRLLSKCIIHVPNQPPQERPGRIVYVKQIIDIDREHYFQVGVQFIDGENGNLL